MSTPKEDESKNETIEQSFCHICLVVKDYDEAIQWYKEKLGFSLIEDIDQGHKRWVLIAPPGHKEGGLTLLLAKASKPEQEPFIGNQTGGRVFLFLNTNDFWRDFNKLKEKGVEIERDPVEQPYGWVAVIKDLYGNKIDFLQMKKPKPTEKKE